MKLIQTTLIILLKCKHQYQFESTTNVLNSAADAQTDDGISKCLAEMEVLTDEEALVTALGKTFRLPRIDVETWGA